MKKSRLTASVNAAKNETTDALLTILNAITNQGQRKKLLKDARVVELLARYGIEYED